MRRARDVAIRFREPLIGLGVAAAAMPLVRAANRPEAERTRDEAPAPAAAAVPEDRDVDAELGATWNVADRLRTVAAAVSRYGIDSGLAAKVYDHARNEGIDPKLAYGLVQTESSFRNTAVSNVGARGLTQLMPRTASWLQPGTRASDLFKPDVSLKVGLRYLRRLLDRYNGDRHLALTAYNRGPGTVDRAVSSGHDPDNGYAALVLGNSLLTPGR